MRGYYRHIPELQRLTRGRPGKVPKGKPRVTDGTLAGIRRETPKQIIQQLPSGRVIIHGNEEKEDYANAILTDIILPNANAGGTPYSKAKRAVKSTIDVGSAWAYCFFNRRGSILHADYRLIYYRDILFEKGKVSEFDTNYIPMIEWMTKGDIEAIIWQEQQRVHTNTEWDLKSLQELLDKGPSGKDENNKSPEEKMAGNNNDGFFKLVKFFQTGVGATFYTYAPTIDKVVHTHVSKDPRGIMPVHGLVPEEDDDNPLGEPLAAISAGKQNLLDFDMQMYQYGQGMGYSPATKLWGNTPEGRIKIAPDAVIKMNGTKATDDFETVNISNQATANFSNNYGLLRGQILNEIGGTGDTTTSGDTGMTSSKTPQGVKASINKLSVSNNDLRLSYELWQGRVYETLLNIQFAESKGTKELELESDTLKRLKLDKQPTFDYDKDYGKIKFTVNASSSRKMSDDEMVQNMQQVLPLMTLQNVYYMAQIGWKLDVGEFNKQLLQRMSIDSMDKIMTKMDDKEAEEAKKQPFPIIDAPQLRMNSADLTAEQIAAILQQQAGVTVQSQQQPIQPGVPPAGLSPQGVADFIVESQKAQAEVMKAQAAAQPQQVQPDKAKTLGESVAWKPGDLKPTERAQALQQVGIKAEMSDTPTPNDLAQATDTATKVDKHAQDMALSADKHANDTGLAIEKHAQDSAIAQDQHLSSQLQPDEPEAVDNPQEEAVEPTNG